MDVISEKGGSRYLPGPAHPERKKAASCMLKPGKLLTVTVLFLMTVGFLHQSVGQCYHRVRDHLCGPLSVEKRAEKVLKTTPLIGEWPCDQHLWTSIMASPD